MSLYIDQNSPGYRVILLGISRPNQESFPLKQEREDQPNFTVSSDCGALKDIKLYVLRSESELRYKLWSQDYPSEYFELGDKQNGFKEFFETYELAKSDQKLRNS